MNTTIDKLIADGTLERMGSHPVADNRTIHEYRPTAGIMLAWRPQPYASDTIEVVQVLDGEAHVIPMLGHDHTKYIDVNADINIKIFRMDPI